MSTRRSSTVVTGISLPSASEALGFAEITDIRGIIREAGSLRDKGHGNTITYSRKVFIPLTQLCRDSCHYCTFSRPPREGEQIYMAPESVLAVARQGEAAGCSEALFTLGDKPELRYRKAKEALKAFGCESTFEYLRMSAELVLNETSLLPHLNPGVMNVAEMAALRPESVSMGLMLEAMSKRLMLPGGVHFGSADKDPTKRLAMIQAAGELNIPFTTGLLIGIGETRRERIEGLLALRELQRTHGHIQEIIIQPFRAKPGTRMAGAADAPKDELLWTIAAARLIFGPEMSVQTPPNLSLALIKEVIDAGINDWGGISPVTIDFVNPEAPWPHVDKLAEEMRAVGRVLTPRLPLYKQYVRDLNNWVDKRLHTKILRASDSACLARESGWSPGELRTTLVQRAQPPIHIRSSNIDPILAAASNGEDLSEQDIVRLFAAREHEFDAVCEAADALRIRTSGDTVRYVVNRNINYTNVCSYRCAFCAFSKGKAAANLRGPAYDLDANEISRRVHEAWQRGATEVCMQGGIHPDYSGETYLAILNTVKDTVPEIHVHAFSPLEVQQGARTLGITVADFLERLRVAGLGSLPGTAAEILDDEVRAVLCPDKLRTQEWLDVVETAHRVGLRTTATIMFGHIEGTEHWARHLLAIRQLQKKTGGFTEFVPLPFVHMEAPIYLKGRARSGPTWREAVLMHAIARLALHPVITNIQVSWVKMGVEGVEACLRAGANDLGGTLMNESISRAAGAEHGQELTPEKMDGIIASIGRSPEQRTTLYQKVGSDRREASYGTVPLTPVLQVPAQRRARLTTHSDQKQSNIFNML
jgi:FO synthase